MAANDFSGVAGELRFDFGYLEGDIDGDSNGDFTIQLTSYPDTLAATDFIL